MAGYTQAPGSDGADGVAPGAGPGRPRAGQAAILLRRSAALAVDMWLVMTAVAVFQYALTWLTRGKLQAGLFVLNDPLVSYGYILLTFSLVPCNLYFALAESSRRQATPGKRLLGLVVADGAGGRIGAGRAFARTTLKFLPWEVGHISLILLSRLQVTGLSDTGFPFTPQTQFAVEETGLAAPARALALALLAASIIVACVSGRAIHDWIARTVVLRRPLEAGSDSRRRPGARSAGAEPSV